VESPQDIFHSPPPIGVRELFTPYPVTLSLLNKRRFFSSGWFPISLEGDEPGFSDPVYPAFEPLDIERLRSFESPLEG